MRSRVGFSHWFAFALVAAALYAPIARGIESARLGDRLSRIASRISDRSDGAAAPLIGFDPGLLVRVDELEGLLASWQTIGGCGAGAGAASSAGLKWVGRNVTGGLFNVQEQVSYSNIGSPQYPEHNFFVNTFINADVTEKWNLGVIVPLVYKYLDDPLHLAPDVPAVNYSNGGLGDVSLLLTRRLGRINATSLTGIVGFPTGVWDATYTPGGTYLNQNAQLGYGKVTGGLVLDQTLDQVWGIVVLGGVAAWRGGENQLNSYRAPTASLYGYTGYFLGRFVPSLGLVLSGYKGHDFDRNSEQTTPLASVAAQAGIEWSSDWIALMIAGTLPYKYDGIRVDESGQPRTPWGFMPWTVSFGISTAPF
jgi:hypothetical protein